MKKTILITGASGFVGRALSRHLLGEAYAVRELSRSADAAYHWHPIDGLLDARALEGVDVVVHLAGEPIAQRWTAAVKQRILESRVTGTQGLVAAMLQQSKPPALMLASGINFYGYQLIDPVSETSGLGAGFLAEVCSAWEAAAEPLVAAGGRVCVLRTGVVLGAGGGALAKMLPAFRMALGGRLGSGSQRMSWVGLQDLVRIYQFAIEDDALQGPINAVAPRAISNGDFTRALGAAIRRPTPFPMPRWLVRTLFGEMAEETLLADLVVEPQVLQKAGFVWRAANIEAVLRSHLNAIKPI